MPSVRKRIFPQPTATHLDTAGKYYDTACGTLYLRARNYDASIGRFTQEDPIRDGGNWYSYCAGNPVNAVDPSGCIIELYDGATPEEIEQYYLAIIYLSQSKTFMDIYNELCESETVFTICFIDFEPYQLSNPNGETQQFEGDRYVGTYIFWNPYSGLVLGDEKSVQSPALGLAHEMSHAKQDLDGVMGKIKAIYSNENARINALEKDNLKYEIQVAKELGEPIRTEYKAKKEIKMTNSIEYGIIENEEFINSNKNQGQFIQMILISKLLGVLISYITLRILNEIRRIL